MFSAAAQARNKSESNNHPLKPHKQNKMVWVGGHEKQKIKVKREDTRLLHITCSINQTILCCLTHSLSLVGVATKMRNVLASFCLRAPPVEWKRTRVQLINLF